MDRCGVFVDAGYLFDAGSQAVFGAKRQRHELRLDVARAIEAIRALQHARAPTPLLRIYWYDGVRGELSTEHLAIGLQDDVKLRLGSVNSAGQQKGVDSLIVTDLTTLARNHAIADAVLIGGDEDLRIGVAQAQELGVRVHLVGISPAAKNQSAALRAEADTRSEIGSAELAPWLLGGTSTNLPAPPTASIRQDPLQRAASLSVSSVFSGKSVPSVDHAPGKLLALELSATERVAAADSWEQGTGLPPEVDRKLLRSASLLAGRALEADEKREIRQGFAKACRLAAGRDGK